MQTAALLQHYFASAKPLLDKYGYAALFAGVAAEGFGLPAPGQSLIIASALLAARHDLHIVPVLVLAFTAAVAGDNLGYAIGHFGGRRLVLRYGRRIGVQAKHLERVEGFFHRYGGAVVAFARFFEVLRQLNGVVAGTSGMGWWRFLGYNALGAALWIALWGYGTYRLGQHMETALALFSRYEPYVIGAAIGAGALLLIYLLWHGRSGD